MKKFIKESWFKVFIIITVFIFGTYYFLIIIKNQQINVSTENCRKIGEEYRKTEIKEELDKNKDFYHPKYAYNEKLNTCLYSGGYIVTDLNFKDGSLKKNVFIIKYIKNLNTNEVIIGSTYIGDQKIFGVSNQEFVEKERELFSND